MRKFNEKQYYLSLEKINNPLFKHFFGKRILITGCNGLIGGTLLDFFMFLNKKYQANIKIICLVRQDLKKHMFFDYSDISIIKQDIREEIKIDGGLDYIFNIASNAHPQAYDKEPIDTMLTNIIGVKNTLELAREKNSILLYTSSSEIYGELKEGCENHIENQYGFIDILNPRSCYSESKRAAETLISCYAKEHCVKSIIVRPGYIFGARFSEHNTRADVEFIKNVLLDKDIILKSPGKQYRSYCYVLDCISAILFTLNYKHYNEAYNIASDTGNVKLSEFASKCAELGGKTLIHQYTEVKGGSTIQNSLLSNDKLKMTGWKENFSLKEGIADTFNNLKR